MMSRTTIFIFCLFVATVVGSILYAPSGAQGPEGERVQLREPEKPQTLQDHKEHAKQDDHKEHAKQDDHEDHKEHAEHGGERVVRLSTAEQREFGIEVSTAGPGTLQVHVSLPGEVALNADRRAHVVPRVSGVVRDVRKTLGDQVRAGEVMAELESRELADLKSAYLAARERVTLAKATHRREADLWKKNISSEQEYLQAKQVLAEARITLRAVEQQLHALGFPEKEIAQLPTHPDQTFTRYSITAPFSGTVIEKHISLGEFLKDDATAFVVADLSSVWVDLRVYQKDLPFVRRGQPVVITAGHGIPDTHQATIAYVGPLVGEQTRTALARVILPNPDGHWRPGLFVTGNIVVENRDVPLLVPKTALQTIDTRPAVFLATPEGFAPQPITLGRSNDTYIEVTSGIAPGQRYVTQGTFTLKAQLAKGTFGDGHAH